MILLGEVSNYGPAPTAGQAAHCHELRDVTVSPMILTHILSISCSTSRHQQVLRYV